MKNKLISYRELIVSFSIFFVLFVIGSIFDQKVTNLVFYPGNEGIFAIILSGILQIPACFCVTFAGAVMFATHKNERGLRNILITIFGLLTIIIAAYFSCYTFMGIGDFERFKNKQKLIKILAFTIPNIFTFTAIGFGFIAPLKHDRENLNKTVAFIWLSVVLEIVYITSIKFLYSRPRPTAVYQGLFEYKQWWQLTPFEAIKEGEILKSHPSAHTSISVSICGCLPAMCLLINKFKDNKKAHIICFYVGLIYGLIASYARMSVGAHYLSDIAHGGLICVALLFVANLLESKLTKFIS